VSPAFTVRAAVICLVAAPLMLSVLPNVVVPAPNRLPPVQIEAPATARLPVPPRLPAENAADRRRLGVLQGAAANAQLPRARERQDRDAAGAELGVEGAEQHVVGEARQCGGPVCRQVPERQVGTDPRDIRRVRRAEARDR